jgi:hypothetical protein
MDVAGQSKRGGTGFVFTIKNVFIMKPSQVQPSKYCLNENGTQCDSRYDKAYRMCREYATQVIC